MNLEIKQQEYEEVFKWLYNKENIALIKEFDITMAHDYNEPYIYYTKEIQDIFKTKAMQRMQRINQLGINVKARYEYHTRLEHSKGAYRRALEFIALNYRKSEWRNYIEQNNLKQYLIDTMIFLAVHDVGHSVLSHGIEKVIGDKNCNHELIGEKICAQNKELVKALEEAKKSNNPKIETKNYDELKNLCDGNIDFDRQDFIFRDLTYLGTIEDSTIINNINSNCSIMKIFEDGKEKSVYAYNESVIKDILKILELRKEIYKNKHYNIYQRMTDITTGITPTDKDIALMLKKSQKPIILVCNKVDDFKKMENETYEFYNLGIGTPYPISSSHAKGIGDVLDAIYDNLPKQENEEEMPEYIKVAIIGKPNVGKSSLVNKILKENRTIVSNIAGTTRDSIDSKYENEYGKYIFIDTAGLRRHSKIEENIEKYSVLRTYLAIERADVCILMIDANDGVTDQDAKIAGKAHEAGKAVIIAINKWDEYNKENGTLENYTKIVYQKLSYLSYAPIIFISAKTGQRVEKLFNLINETSNNNATRISTPVLNEILAEAVSMVQPPTDKGKRLKVLYITQVSTKPPTFAIFVNDKKLFHFSYERYIVNKLRQEFNFKGTPIRILIRERKDK